MRTPSPTATPPIDVRTAHAINCTTTSIMKPGLYGCMEGSHDVSDACRR